MDKTLERIEAALARIEKAAARPARSDGDLQARHDRLKGAVSESLCQLDELLAGQKQ